MGLGNFNIYPMFKINSWLHFKETNVLKVLSDILNLHGEWISSDSVMSCLTTAEEKTLLSYLIN